MQISKLSFFLALIVFDFYSFEICEKKIAYPKNMNIFLEKYFENQKILMNKKT